MVDSYPSDSITETLITQIQNLGGSPTSYGLGELNRLLADLQGGGGGGDWPASNGTGPGNLVAQTPVDDSVGYDLNDQGSGGFSLDSSGTGTVHISSQATAGGIEIVDESSHGVTISSGGSGGVEIESVTTGPVTINTFGAVAGNGIAIEDHESSGILIQADGVTNNGRILVVVAAGTGVLELENTGTGGIHLAGGAGGTHIDNLLTVASGHLATAFTLGTSPATFLTTASLAVGTWVVTMNASVVGEAASEVIEIAAATGTATATFGGQTSGETNSQGSADAAMIGLTFIATVTVAGTLVFNASASSLTGAPVISATTDVQAYPNATGYTALKVA